VFAENMVMTTSSGTRRQEKRGPGLQIALGVAPIPLEVDELGAEQDLEGMD
jgi:hypothetical protein